MKQLTVAIMVALLGLTACGSFAGTPNSQTTQTLQTQIKPKAKGVWIDVRTPDEFGAGHLKGAINVPVNDIASQIAHIEPNKNAPINLYCRSGRRAETARQTLLSMGYTNVTNHGGYDELIKQGYR